MGPISTHGTKKLILSLSTASFLHKVELAEMTDEDRYTPSDWWTGGNSRFELVPG